MRILGLDIGSKRIGVAISDESEKIASWISVIARKQKLEDDIKAIDVLIKKYNVSEVVVGFPLNMDGSVGTQANQVSLFIEDLKKDIAVPITTWDERLTSLQGERVLIEADISRKKRKQYIDKLSAQIILQCFLDYRNKKNEQTDIR